VEGERIQRDKKGGRHRLFFKKKTVEVLGVKGTYFIDAAEFHDLCFIGKGGETEGSLVKRGWIFGNNGGGLWRKVMFKGGGSGEKKRSEWGLKIWAGLVPYEVTETIGRWGGCQPSRQNRVRGLKGWTFLQVGGSGWKDVLLGGLYSLQEKQYMVVCWRIKRRENRRQIYFGTPERWEGVWQIVGGEHTHIVDAGREGQGVRIVLSWLATRGSRISPLGSIRWGATGSGGDLPGRRWTGYDYCFIFGGGNAGLGGKTGGAGGISFLRQDVKGDWAGCGVRSFRRWGGGRGKM